MTKWRKSAIAAALLVSLFAAGCTVDSQTNGVEPTADAGGLPQDSEKVELDPADFTTEIDNPWWPMTIGSKWVYKETDLQGANQRVEVTVTDKTKKIANGVTARVVRDEVTEDGVPVEVTDDWYAQDAEGNIWYLGEATTEYEDGKPVSTEGSFEAGIHGAQAGIVMPADPRPGLRYRQEYLKGEAEDRGEIVAIDAQAEVPFGHFRNVVMTKDTNPLEPKVLEFKFYARGVGPVLAVSVSGSSDREELVSYEKGD